MVWLPSGNLGCDTCDAVHLSMGHRGTTATVARSKGWHIYQGPAEGGRDLTSHLDPKCVGTPRSGLPKPPPSLDGDLMLPLFSDAA